MNPFAAAALMTLITEGVEAGTGALAARRQSKKDEDVAGLQNVLQGLNPQMAGQQTVRRGQGQGGWESHIASAMADPLVQKWMENKLTGLGEDQSTKRTNLPDASQAVGRSGPLGGPMVDETTRRRPSAASRAVAAPSPANPNRSTWTQEGTRTNFGPLAPPTAKDGPWRSWQTAPNSSGATAWTWPNGQPVTLQQVNDPSISMEIRQTWRRNTSLPSGTRRPTGTQPYQRGGFLDPLVRGLRG